MSIAYQRALILHEAGRFADAEWQLRESREIQPRFEQARAMLAVCLVQQGKFAAAREAAELTILAGVAFMLITWWVFFAI